MNYDFDAIIIGAGVVGLSIGHALSKNGKKILILEKNNKFGLLNSSRNTEVIHAGIYYDPNSLKKRLASLLPIRSFLIFTNKKSAIVAKNQSEKILKNAKYRKLRPFI